MKPENIGKTFKYKGIKNNVTHTLVAVSEDSGQVCTRTEINGLVVMPFSQFKEYKIFKKLETVTLEAWLDRYGCLVLMDSRNYSVSKRNMIRVKGEDKTVELEEKKENENI